MMSFGIHRRRRAGTVFPLAALSLFALVLAAVPARAKSAWAGLELVPVQEGGRVKPLDTYARETAKSFTGKTRFQDKAPMDFLLDILFDGRGMTELEMFQIGWIPLKEAISIDPDRRHFSFTELAGNEELGRYLDEAGALQSRGEDLSRTQREAMSLYSLLVRFDQLAGGMEPRIVPIEGREWASLAAGAQTLPVASEAAGQWVVVAAGYRAGGPSTQEDLARLAPALQSLSAGDEVLQKKLRVEVLYNRLMPFRLAWVLYLIAFVPFLFPLITKRSAPRWPMVPMLLGYALHVTGLGMRWYLAGRAPWSNMYESMTLVGWGLLTIGMILAATQKNRAFLGAGAGVGTITMWLADWLPVDQAISPLVAVLRSYWLTYHVSVLLLSYSALALATGVAHYQLYLRFFRPDRPEMERQAAKLTYDAIKVGTFLLATGIMLGAVWASESWGRYWAWDPKETWALITLLGYLVIVHGRFAGWMSEFRQATACVLAFFLVIMTYYGVNFFLVGLHSYAGGEARALPPLLVGYVVSEIAIIALAGMWEKSGKRFGRPPSPTASA